MIQSISIVSRDTSCMDCKLTVRKVIKRNPGWFKKFFLGTKPITEIVVDEWYGHADRWYPRAGSNKKASLEESLRFHNLWATHCQERNMAKTFGPFSTLFVLREGQWELKNSTKL